MSTINDPYWQAVARRYINDAAGLAFVLRQELGGEEDVDWQAVALGLIVEVSKPVEPVVESSEEPDEA